MKKTNLFQGILILLSALILTSIAVGFSAALGYFIYLQTLKLFSL
jgi:hypothetical protein